MNKITGLKRCIDSMLKIKRKTNENANIAICRALNALIVSLVEAKDTP